MNKLKIFLSGFVLVAGLNWIPLCLAETAIIVHPSNSSSTSPSILKRIFLGKAKEFDGGGEATPIYLSEGNAVRSSFNKDFLRKSDAQMKAYWGRLVFTGKAEAPSQAASDEDMIKQIASNPKLVGYIDSSKVTDGVKVIHKF